MSASGGQTGDPRSSLSVCFVVTKLTGGGAERAMSAVASEFAQRGLKIDVLSLHGAQFDEYAVQPNVRIARLGKGKVAACLPRLLRQLRRIRPHWVVSASLNTDLALLASRPVLGRGVKILCSQQNNLSALLEGEAARGRRIAARWGIKLYRSADRLTAISRGARDDLARHLGWDPQRISVIPNPLDLRTITALRAESVPEGVLSSTTGPTIVAAGRLTPQKDFVTLLRAMCLVRAARPGVELAILGEGPERHPLQSIAEELGLRDVVRFPGFVRNPFAIMARARVFVLSSRYEGFGNVVAEALACGAEVVSTDCPYGPAEILDGGRFGWLVPVGDPRAMANAILEALEKRRAERAAVDVWLQQFSLPRVATAYLRVMTDK